MSAGKPREPWFPAKTYGWGWGPPRVWQGWAVLAGFFVLLAGGALVLLDENRIWIFLGYAYGLVAILLAICWVKGERPSWRWGKKKEAAPVEAKKVRRSPRRPGR